MGKHKPRIKVKAEPKTVAPSHVAACALAVVVSLLIAWHLGPSPADGLIRVTLEDEEGAAGLQLRGFGSSYPEVASVTAGSAVAREGVTEGQQLRRVNHQSVVDMAQKDVMSMLADKRRPLRLTFAPKEAAGAGGGAERQAASKFPGRTKGPLVSTTRPDDFDPKAAAAEFRMAELLEDIATNVPGAQYVSHDPPIITIDDFLTDEECASIIEIGTPGLEPSTGTGGYKNGKFQRIKMESRTSHNSWLMNGLEHHQTVAAVDRRIANVTGLFEGNSEHYQVLRYAPPDQFYKSHSDFIDSQVMQNSGPRLFTFFLYLQDVRDSMGGETFFPFAQSLAEPDRPPCRGGKHGVTFAHEVDCGLLVAPKKRSALLWPNVDFDDFGRGHSKTTHAALAISEECDAEDTVSPAPPVQPGSPAGAAWFGTVANEALGHRRTATSGRLMCGFTSMISKERTA